ncbi:F200B protein, partial [Acromyrmex insinuator]
VEEILKKFNLDFGKCSSIMTDGAKAMTGLKKGFIGQLKQRNIHRIIHQEALAGKHKFLTHRHCLVRWFSVAKLLEDVTFLTELTFITDISNQLRLLNLKLQRTNQNISQLVSHVDSFRRKLQVLKSHLNDNIFHFFPSCQILLEEHDNNCNFKEYIHFLDLQDELCDLQNDIAFKTVKETGADFYKMLKESSPMKLIKNERRSTLNDDSFSHLMRLATCNMQIDVSDLANKRFRKSE